MDLQNTVKEALNALYHHPDQAIRKQADRWLQDYQRSAEAWQVVDHLLNDTASNLETLIFRSQTLRRKVQRDFEQLPCEAFRPLQNSLIALLKSFRGGHPNVRTQISLAVAALAVHAPRSWGDGGVVGWIREEMKNSDPQGISIFLEVLRVLPEEVFNYKVAARPDRRRSFEHELAASGIEIALSLLSACLSIDELTEQVLEAFASWLRIGHRIPPSSLASHPLVLKALSSLEGGNILSEASVNVISELIYYTRLRDEDAVTCKMPLIQVIVPRIMNLKPQLRDPSKDEEDVKAIARLFADMGDAYVELIATGSDVSMVIVQALLEVASHPESDIACMTFNFWHNLQLVLTEHSANGDEAERARRLQVFRSSYELLVSLVSVKVEYPGDYSDLSREDQKDFKRTRYDVADVLIDAALVLGGDATLRILYMKLIEVASKCGNNELTDWRPVEAALYSIQAISDHVLVTEGEVMPQVMSLLPNLPNQPQLLQTVCRIIGSYSRWLDASSLSLLPPLIDILVRGMSISDDTAAAAALAFRNICGDCKRKLSMYYEGLFEIYKKAVVGEGSFKVSDAGSLRLVEALSMVITELPAEHAKKALEALCIPNIAPLQDIVNQGPLVLGQTPARDITLHIDRLASIFRHVNHPAAVADAVGQLWPIFKAIFDTCAWDTRTMESLCGACKYAMRTSKALMGETVGLILEKIQELYKQHQQPCFLYLSSEAIKIFGSDPYLNILIESLFSHTASMLTKIQDFILQPDLVDDCFSLASRCTRYCPQLFFPSPVFTRLMDCSLIGITVQHREASNSILTFLADIFANSSPGKPYASICDNVIIPRGPFITRILVAALTGALPSSRLEAVAHTLLTLTLAHREKTLEWARESISLIPSDAVTDVEKSRFLQALSEAASGSGTNELPIPIEEVSEVCRRNPFIQETVQGALRPLEVNIISNE